MDVDGGTPAGGGTMPTDDVPPPSPAHPSGRIVHIEVENFKSYAGRQTIGPFKTFTAVVGPNGSGKSNLMDAISFVLGVRGAQLRGALKELLYAGLGPDGAPPRRGGVELVFEAGDGERVRFARTIAPSSDAPDATFASTYRLDGRAVSAEAYDARLRSFGILVKARNFLVFQGDIEAVASMTPAQVTDMFEHVSGSGDLKAEYEAAEKAKSEAEERATYAFSKKRATAAERRQKRDQKEEAEKYMRQQKELAREDLKTTHYLLRLYHAERDAATARASAAAERGDLAAAQASQADADEAAEAARRQAASLHKQRMLAERKVNAGRAELERRNPSALRAHEEAARLAKREKELGARVAAAARAKEEQEAAVARLEADLVAVEAAAAAAEAEADDDDGLHLDAAAQAEYYRVKEEAGSKTARMRATRDAVLAGARADETALAALEAMLAGVRDRGEGVRAEAGVLRARVATLQAELDAAKGALATTEADLVAADMENRRTGSLRDEWAAKLATAEDALRDAKADRKESERDRRAAEAVAHMQGMFQGVHGRVTELAKISQRRYNLALAVVLGKDMDSVVVDTERTAKDCIAYLKQARLAPMTFIPADSVRAKPLNERLRTLGGSAKLAIDLLEYEPALERAMLSICGNTLVCDTDREAKALAFQGPERHKVVALDGTLISRAGLITGGLSGGMERRAARFDDAALASLKAERQRCADGLASLQSARDAERVVEGLRAEAARLKREVELKQADLEASRKRLAEKEAEAGALDAERTKREPEAAKLRATVDVAKDKAAAALERIHEVEDRVFADFSKKVGVANVRAHMEQHAAAVAEKARRRMQLAQQASKIKHQLSYERRRDLAAPAAAVAAELAAAAARRRELEAADREAAAALLASEAALAGERQRVAELRGQAEAAEAAARDARRAATAAAARAGALRASAASHEADAEAAATRVRELEDAASVESVPLPRSEAGPAGAENADPNASPHLYDYSVLPRALTAALAPRDRERVDAELRADVDARAADLARGAPNLKALDQYEAVRAREREQADEADAARDAARAAAERFARVRARRHDLFMAAFEHAAAAVNTVFKDLTRSPAHPTGGSAYLSLESADDPYLGGVKFTAMPPAKRYRDMDALSGGEKTLSALALLFAVHSFQAAPFFVLDEVDAALDAANVARVAAYVARKARGIGGGPPLQSVVISLKDGFFQHADALVGVCRDPDAGCSATLTFDLQPYGPPAAAA